MGTRREVTLQSSIHQFNDEDARMKGLMLDGYRKVKQAAAAVPTCIMCNYADTRSGEAGLIPAPLSD